MFNFFILFCFYYFCWLDPVNHSLVSLNEVYMTGLVETSFFCKKNFACHPSMSMIASYF